jgi:alpha-tubulin suppressor-like RCC1 family protein
MPNTKLLKTSDGINFVDMDSVLVSKSYMIDVYPQLLSTYKLPALYSWGTNSVGQLGQGNLTAQSSPVQVGLLTNWQQLSARQGQTWAIKTDGTLWAWGNNTVGQLGDGTIVAKSSPVQIGALANWVSAGNGLVSSHAVKNDNTLWSCGYNAFGGLGDGTTVGKSSPVQVGTLTTWASVAGGYGYFTALKLDGTLWACGKNSAGQLGNGMVTNASTPVQVGTLNTWAKVANGYASSFAIKKDGTLWSWGDNTAGQLGLGDTTSRSSPTQLGTATWSAVDTSTDGAGTYFTVAVKTDGTLWAWGFNSDGELGIGMTSAAINSPVQVGTLTNWKSVACGYYHTTALKTDGTLWAWGKNTSGQLGTGDTLNYSSPVQVGLQTSWKSVVNAGSFSLALQEGLGF